MGGQLSYINGSSGSNTGHADQSHTLCCVFCLHRLLHCLHNFCLDLLVLHLQTTCGKKAMGDPTFNLINREGLTQVMLTNHTPCVVSSACTYCSTVSTTSVWISLFSTFMLPKSSVVKQTVNFINRESLAHRANTHLP